MLTADLVQITHDARSLRLVVLNSCAGAQTDVNDPFAGIAQQFIADGLPAVIAMQFDISDNAAKKMSEEFYEELAKGLAVDVALAEALASRLPLAIPWAFLGHSQIGSGGVAQLAVVGGVPGIS